MYNNGAHKYRICNSVVEGFPQRDFRGFLWKVDGRLVGATWLVPPSTVSTHEKSWGHKSVPRSKGRTRCHSLEGLRGQDVGSSVRGGRFRHYPEWLRWHLLQGASGWDAWHMRAQVALAPGALLPSESFPKRTLAPTGKPGRAAAWAWPRDDKPPGDIAVPKPSWRESPYHPVQSEPERSGRDERGSKSQLVINHYTHWTSWLGKHHWCRRICLKLTGRHCKVLSPNEWWSQWGHETKRGLRRDPTVTSDWSFIFFLHVR